MNAFNRTHDILGLHKNPRSLSSPKMELWLKTQNIKKGGDVGGLRGVREGRGWEGGAGEMQGFWEEAHAKTSGLYQVPN